MSSAPPPGERWELDAPTSWILWQEGYGARPAMVVWLALTELIARHAVRLEQRKREIYLLPGTAPAPTTGPLAALYASIHDLQTRALNEDGRAVSGKDLRREVNRRWGSPEGFAETEVLPYSEAGYAAFLTLHGHIEALEQELPGLASADPERALATVALSGAAVLLAGKSWPVAKAVKSSLDLHAVSGLHLDHLYKPPATATGGGGGGGG